MFLLSKKIIIIKLWPFVFRKDNSAPPYNPNMHRNMIISIMMIKILHLKKVFAVNITVGHISSGKSPIELFSPPEKVAHGGGD